MCILKTHIKDLKNSKYLNLNTIFKEKIIE